MSGHHGHHGHSDATLKQHRDHVTSLKGATAKKTQLFDSIHDLIVHSVADCKSLGATDAMMVPFTETIKRFEASKADWIALDLG